MFDEQTDRWAEALNAMGAFQLEKKRINLQSNSGSIPKNLLEFLGNKFVLVIEPSQNYRSSIRNYLTNLKVKNMRFVGSIGEAKREMLAIQIGLFISEWQLSEKNGLQFCRELRKDAKHRNTPFLLTGTENLRKDVILASEGGITNYLLKPFSYEDFSAQIVAMIAYLKEPSHFNSIIERAEAHLNSHEEWIAESLLKEALLLKPNSSRAMCGMGRLELMKKDFAMAVSYFQEAIASNPDYVEAYKFLLQIAEERSDYKGMLNAAKMLHDRSPDNPRYPLIVAAAHMELGNLKESEENFKMSVKLSPTLAEGYKGLGSVYYQQREFSKSKAQLEKALDLEKEDISTLNSLGLALMKQNLLSEALQKFKLALALNQNDARIWFNIGLTYDQQGDLQNAKMAFQKAVNSDPTFAKAQRNLNRLNNGHRTTPMHEGDQTGECSKFVWKKSA